MTEHLAAAGRQPLRIGVCGFGSIGGRHGRLLAERDDVVVHVFDPALRGGDPVIDEAAIEVAGSFDELLERAPDGLVVATPDHLHASMTIAACRAGTAVLVEKPVAPDTASADEMDRVATETGTPVLVGHVLRHTETLRVAHEQLETSAIGQPQSFHATLGAYETLELAHSRFGESRPFGLVFDYCHEWEFLQWLLGPVRRVVTAARTAEAMSLLEQPNVVDVLLELRSGVIGTVHLDYVERNGARTTRIVGDGGVLTFDLRAHEVHVSVDGATVHAERFDEPRDAIFRRQLDHFVDVIRRETDPCVSIREARRAVAVAEAVVASSRSGSWQHVDD